jgi:hypothetical protein
VSLSTRHPDVGAYQKGKSNAYVETFVGSGIMALSYNTRKALEMSAVFIADSLKRAKTVSEREDSLRYLKYLVENMLEVGLEERDMKKFFPAHEVVYRSVWNDVVNGAANGVNSNDNPHK